MPNDHMDVDQDVAAGYLANFPLAIRPPVAGQNNNPFAPAAEAAEELINPDAAHDDGDIMPMLMPIVGDMVDGGMGGANHNPAINPIEHAFNMLLDFFVFKPEADHPHPQPAPAAARCRHEKIFNVQMWIIAGSLVSIAITAAKFMSVFKSSSGAFEPCYQAQDRLFALETARVAAVLTIVFSALRGGLQLRVRNDG